MVRPGSAATGTGAVQGLPGPLTARAPRAICEACWPAPKLGYDPAGPRTPCRAARRTAGSSTSARPARARAPSGRPRPRPPADRRAGAAMTLSIVLPCYKSAMTLQAQLPAFLEWLRRHYPDSEVIVVDDGSS